MFTMMWNKLAAVLDTVWTQLKLGITWLLCRAGIHLDRDYTALVKGSHGYVVYYTCQRCKRQASVLKMSDYG